MKFWIRKDRETGDYWLVNEDLEDFASNVYRSGLVRWVASQGYELVDRKKDLNPDAPEDTEDNEENTE